MKKAPQDKKNKSKKEETLKKKKSKANSSVAKGDLGGDGDDFVRIYFTSAVPSFFAKHEGSVRTLSTRIDEEMAKLFRPVHYNRSELKFTNLVVDVAKKNSGSRLIFHMMKRSTTHKHNTTPQTKNTRHMRARANKQTLLFLGQRGKKTASGKEMSLKKEQQPQAGLTLYRVKRK